MGWFVGGYWGGSKTQGWMRAVAAAVAGSAWSTTDKGANFSLANANARAAFNSADGNGGVVRGAKGSSSGWRHFEIKFVSISGRSALMLATSAVALDGSNQAGYANTFYWRDDGILYFNGSDTGANFPFAVGNALGVDYNETTGDFVGSINGVVKFSGTFTAGTKLYPALAGFAPNTFSADLNTGGNTFTSNPNNYTAWG